MLFLFCSFVIFLACLIYALKLYLWANDGYWPSRGVELIAILDLIPLSKILKFDTPFHEADTAIYKKFKNQLKVKFGGTMEFRRPHLFLIDLELIRHVLVKDFDSFINRREFGSKTELFRKMLINMDNPPWKDVRSAMSPAFTTGKIKKMFGIFSESGHKMEEFILAQTLKSSDVELKDIFGRYTLDVIASTAFGLDSENFKHKNSPFSINGQRFQDQFLGVGMFKAAFAAFFPGFYELIGLELLDKKAVEFFTHVVLKTMKSRDETGEVRNDFLQLMMDVRSGKLEVGENEISAEESQEWSNSNARKVLTDEIIIAQCILFFFAGFDTTETLISFAAYEMALNPDVQERLAKELRDALSKEPRGKLTYEIVNNLEYLDMVISETLRKFPPIPRHERRSNKEYILPGTNVKIEAGTMVTIPAWGIHHDPEFYPEPEKFIPERFTTENKNTRHPFAYMPFGLGNRQCIAMRFARLEGKTALAHLILRYKLEPCGRTTIPMKFESSGSGIVKPFDGMWLKVTSRN